MGIEIDALALENWYDLLAFLPRSQLGKLASSTGNRRFATILQTFLHKYVRQITIGRINLRKTTKGDENDYSTKARVNLWHSDSWGWGREVFPVADWPMPENITNFESIQLSYLDLSVFHFLQQFQQNSLFININLHIATNYSDHASEIAQCLSHLLPLIASIESIEVKGSHLIDIIIYKSFFKHLHTREEQVEVDYTPILARTLNLARILELRETFGTRELLGPYYGGYYTQQIGWLCHWLYTPRDDRKAKVLILLEKYFKSNELHKFVKILKQDFLLAKEAVSYFIGIQTEPVDLFYMDIPRAQLETLTNSKTNERITCKKDDC